MRRVVFTFFSLLIYFFVHSQISIESFRLLENDLDARVHSPKRDLNGELAALIKIVTPETGFDFDGGSLSIVSSERKTGEYWLYVPRGARSLTIMHDKLGILRNYAYPLPIEAATVYEMKLVTGSIETKVIAPELKSQWLLITAEPSGALIYLDEQFEGTGALQKKLLPGSYTYRAEAPLYHPQAGKINITAEKKEEIHIQLQPNYGYLEVISFPETGAMVMIDNEDAGFVTNGKSDRLKSGEYTVKVVKEQYSPATGKIAVTDGQTATITLDMAPNFAVVEVELPEDASLFINNEGRGTGTWSGRLSAGVYTFEARKDRHSNARQDVQLLAGDRKKITLDPVPVTGSADVVSNPPKASVSLNGKNYGTTPVTLNNLLIGEYTLTLEKQGFGTVTKKITITSGGSTMISETLPAGMEVTIASDPSGARLEVDGKEQGHTPATLTLGFGTHNIRLTNNSKVVQEAITVTQGGKSSFSYDVSEFHDPFGEQMALVKGGAFTMGCTGEQGSDCDDDEKPA
ncbi:MAG: PEGA domain-containing protein, partial [Bacteroidales bacterium]|nr:PEGA domain-containing protein [Bacteroidales bacterium]